MVIGWKLQLIVYVFSCRNVQYCQTEKPSYDFDWRMTKDLRKKEVKETAEETPLKYVSYNK